MKNKIVIVVASVLVLIGVFIAAMKFYENKRSSDVQAIAETDFKKLVPDYAPKMGAENPKVYLVEFLDPECESCRQFYPYVKMLMKEYEGKIQLVVRYAPFHQNSRLAIKILEAARLQGKFWETLEVLFQHQPEWGDHHNPKPELMWNYLPQAGVNLDQIKSDMHDFAIESMIEREEQAVKELGVRGTPQFFVNGRPLETFGLEPLKELIESELNR